MKVSERLAIIDKIGRTLQARYRYDEIDEYLSEFDIPRPEGITVNSKWVYSKAALRGAPLEKIAKIAEDLGVGPISKIAAEASPPACWKEESKFRLFVSHIARNKKIAMRLSTAQHDELAPHFKKKGINDIRDASGCVGPDGNLQIIDFATERIDLEC